MATPIRTDAPNGKWSVVRGWLFSKFKRPGFEFKRARVASLFATYYDACTRPHLSHKACGQDIRSNRSVSLPAWCSAPSLSLL